ncbi:MAG TPA: ion transporter [Spirochaetota bacterium]|nr:ion transporter [Spirochaetota bacterium]HOM38869.1 ion transporter [Spirochaetota bacterium]HPQ49164.1 ion transporter [Spirochaetota bacterium]
MRNIFETFINIFIILVVISTVLEEIFSLNVSSYKDFFIYINFVFDFVFTLEFIIRSVISKNKNGFRYYLTTGLGWIDFVSSIPLLVLNSGPSLYSYLTNDFTSTAASFISFVSVMKIAKIIRVTRIFRLLRFLKLLKNLNFLDSKIAQRHLNYIVSLIISMIILSVLVMNILQFNINSFIEDDMKNNYKDVLNSALIISIKTGVDFSSVLKDILVKDYRIIEAYYRETKILSKDFNINFSFLSYIDKFNFNNVTIYYIDYNLIKSEAIFSIIIIIIIIVLSISIIFIYSRKFALEISDPIILVSKGFNESNFFIRIRDDYRHDDEIKELIKGYNDIWLNTKLKYFHEIYEEKINLDISEINIDDITKGL